MKKISPKTRKILNIAFFMIGVALAALSFRLFGKTAFIIYAICFTLVFCPLIMRAGIGSIMYERLCVINQISADMPIDYNKKRFVIGYFKAFTPMYAFIFASLLMPARGLWVVPFIPSMIAWFVFYKMLMNPWVDIGRKKSRYRLIHLTVLAALLIAAVLIRVVVFPSVYAGV